MAASLDALRVTPGTTVWEGVVLLRVISALQGRIALLVQLLATLHVAWVITVRPLAPERSAQQARTARSPYLTPISRVPPEATLVLPAQPPVHYVPLVHIHSLSGRPAVHLVVHALQQPTLLRGGGHPRVLRVGTGLPMHRGGKS